MILAGTRPPGYATLRGRLAQRAAEAEPDEAREAREAREATEDEPTGGPTERSESDERTGEPSAVRIAPRPPSD
jgi:hypothetical protein